MWRVIRKILVRYFVWFGPHYVRVFKFDDLYLCVFKLPNFPYAFSSPSFVFWVIRMRSMLAMEMVSGFDSLISLAICQFLSFSLLSLCCVDRDASNSNDTWQITLRRRGRNAIRLSNFLIDIFTPWQDSKLATKI